MVKAVFGKPATDTLPGGYCFLSRAPEFENPVLDQALRRLVTALEWKPTPDGDPHANVFGTLRVGEVAIIAKFIDAGRDATGRPHSLRVECVLWDKLQTAPPEELVPAGHWLPGDVIRLIGDTRSFSCASSTCTK